GHRRGSDSRCGRRKRNAGSGVTAMEFLVEFEIEVPAGAPRAEVDRRYRAESAAAGKLAKDGHLVRLWWPPPVRAGPTAVGLSRADSQTERDDLLPALPPAEWLLITVPPLEGPPNDPATASR